MLEKLWNRFNYSAVTATMALVFSAATLFFNFFNEVRAVKLTVANYRVYDEGDYRFPIVISNVGNRTETILGVGLILTVDGGAKTIEVEPKTAHVLEPGKAIAIALEGKFDRDGSLTEADWHKEQAQIPAYINASAIQPDGTVIEQMIPLGTLALDINRQFSFKQLALPLPGRIDLLFPERNTFPALVWPYGIPENEPQPYPATN
ncbi:hypothetical protein [Rhizobium sp. BK251]|uniref:hypothetical protein n=1 Tax=Rhizobium sp. BK251 TaxID=2512125 RepID=UPI0010435EB1|nr:hypothetical protein [Rhizobium sp. BK251]TCL62338.1 hypothetical protein EV286_1226 [Rhizobium sp. BK251]